MDGKIKSQPICYEIKELLGEGLSSCVYKAIRKDERGLISQEVAIKVLKSKTAVEDWRREFASLQAVDSEFCSEVLGAEWLMEKPALILKHIDGVNLEKLCSQMSLSELEKRSIIHSVHSGLVDLKEAGLSHGDLSPKNVLISNRGEIKLIDFGLANVTSLMQRATEAFASPERLKQGVSNYYSDLYSLGKLAEWMRLDIGDQALLSATAEGRSYSTPQEEGDKEFSRVKLMLSEKVIEVQERLKPNFASTQVYQLKDKKGGWAVGRMVSALLCLFFLAHGEGQTAARSSYISYASNSWTKISVNGQSLGYAPLHLKRVDPGAVTLQWETAKQRGEKRLMLIPGEHKILSALDISN